MWTTDESILRLIRRKHIVGVPSHPLHLLMLQSHPCLNVSLFLFLLSDSSPVCFPVEHCTLSPPLPLALPLSLPLCVCVDRETTDDKCKGLHVNEGFVSEREREIASLPSHCHCVIPQENGDRFLSNEIGGHSLSLSRLFLHVFSVSLQTLECCCPPKVLSAALSLSAAPPSPQVPENPKR